MKKHLNKWIVKKLSEKENRYYFRCQYQIGEEVISEAIEGDGYLSVSQMVITILKLVEKVAEEKGKIVGGKVALEGLRKIRQLGLNSNTDWQDNGSSKTRYLKGRKKAKKAKDRTERFDIEFSGLGGRDTKDNVIISGFIDYFKKRIHAKEITNKRKTTP